MTRLVNRWQAERVIRAAGSVFLAISLFLAVLLGLLALLWWRTGQPLAHSGVAALGGAALLGWLAGLGVLFAVRLRRPAPVRLAKRVDTLLGLPDDLLSLAEWPAGEASFWRESGWKKTEATLARCDLRQAWPLFIPRGTLCAAVLALALSAALGILAGWQWNEETRRLAAEEAARTERLALAQEMLEDWKNFAGETKDPELREFFAESQPLEAALKASDPMEAMLEMNRLEAQLSGLEAQIARESIASHSGKIAEALEAFEGMGAMGAALRQEAFEAAARQAEALKEALGKNREGTTPLHRAAAVSEMLSRQAEAAGKEGHQSLSKALGELAKAAAQSKDGAVPNRQLGSPNEQLGREFSKEAARRSRGRMAGIGKQQLDALRRRLQGENPDANRGPSLCQNSGDQPGKGQQSGTGLHAGTGAGGPPLGEQTALADAGREESVSGVLGEGESETRTLSATSGSGGATAGEDPLAAPADYLELSRKAVADETLPLAHRRVIRTYFERIRPPSPSP